MKKKYIAKIVDCNSNEPYEHCFFITSIDYETFKVLVDEALKDINDEDSEYYDCSIWEEIERRLKLLDKDYEVIAEDYTICMGGVYDEY